jgi:hypothetical protein
VEQDIAINRELSAGGYSYQWSMSYQQRSYQQRSYEQEELSAQGGSVLSILTGS